MRAGPCNPPFLEVSLTGHITSYETRTNHELATARVQSIDSYPPPISNPVQMPEALCKGLKRGANASGDRHDI
jgi:hypothetical protein